MEDSSLEEGGADGPAPSEGDREKELPYFEERKVDSDSVGPGKPKGVQDSLGKLLLRVQSSGNQGVLEADRKLTATSMKSI